MIKLVNKTKNSLKIVSYQVDQNRNINETLRLNKYDIQVLWVFFQTSNYCKLPNFHHEIISDMLGCLMPMIFLLDC